MAHRIAKTNGKDAFMSKRQIAWHGLGQTLNHDVNSREAMVAAGLDYQVEKAPIYTVLENENSGSPVAFPEKMITYRTDDNTKFGIVGKDYEIIQNLECFGFFDAVLGSNNMFYETAGALNEGATVFITAKVPQSLVIGKDIVDQYLLLTNSHDGSSAIRAMFTPVRVVCNNTLQVALKGRAKGAVSMRHTKNVRQQFKTAQDILGFAKRQGEIAEQQYNQIAKMSITDTDLRDYIDNVFPNLSGKEETSTRLANIRSDVFNYTMQGPGQQEIEGNMWWAYNGITGYFQNFKNGSAEDLMKSNIFGSGAETMGKALLLALA